MKVVYPRYEILTPITGDELKEIELIGRVCYKSEDKITKDSAEAFVKMLIKKGHESVLEHSKLSVLFVCDRGISHEIVRHRIASYAQESTRYCNYAKEKFGGEISFIKPFYFDADSNGYREWSDACRATENAYLELLSMGYTPQEARTVLPNSLETELVMTTNYREWRHFLKLRTAPDAHPQMQELCCPLLHELASKIPVVFDDIFANQSDSR